MNRHLCLGLLLFCGLTKVHAEPEETFVPIYEIFDQGETQWCWAYSSFHSLRTFFTAHDDANGADEWRVALSRVDSAQSFKEHMGKFFSPTKTGNPQDFVAHFRRENALPDPGWKAYYPTGKKSKRAVGGISSEHRLSSKEILKKAYDGLRRGVPAAYCNPPHCMMLFGGTHQNGEPSHFTFADSDGGRIYKWTAKKAEDELDLVMMPETLP